MSVRVAWVSTATPHVSSRSRAAVAMLKECDGTVYFSKTGTQIRRVVG